MPSAIITNGALWGRAFIPWQKRHFQPRDPLEREWVALPGAEARIAADFGTIAMTVAGEDMPDLPPLNVVVTSVALPDAVMVAYASMQEELFAAVGERGIEAVSPLVATGKCAQIANGFLYGEGNEDPVRVHTVKIDWLRELLESLDGEPLLIAYEFVEDLRAIRRALGDIPALGGPTPAREAKRLIEAWNAGTLPLLAFHPASAGHGINLQFGGSRMAWLSPSWSAELTEQAIARIYRPGQTQRVTIHVCVAAGTVDEMKRDRVHGKMSAQEAFKRHLERSLMHERTAFRLAMLANGFQPLLNDCKRAIETGWPTKVVDEAEILSWDRSALASTGLRLDGDLAVIDVDVIEPDLIEALVSAIDHQFPELFVHGLVRHAGGPKEAWIARVDEPFRRLASRRWYRGNDPDDPAVPKHLVECFGSLGTRQFAIDGPHARDRRGEVIDIYQFAGGASPATVPRASLPALPKAAYAHACDLFDEIAAAAGLTAVKEVRGEAAPMCFELDAGMVVETREHGAMTVAELEHFMRKRQAHGDAPAALRCSGTFHDPTRVRTNSHLINWGRYGLGIYDTMTETTWHRRERAPIEDTMIANILLRIAQRAGR